MPKRRFAPGEWAEVDGRLAPLGEVPIEQLGAGYPTWWNSAALANRLLLEEGRAPTVEEWAKAQANVHANTGPPAGRNA